uniref:type II toxin-antitoxin system RelE family toxin n=1 Tax=Crenothrix polyspora TaxID=360316 RepID=UPI000B356D4A
MNIIDWKPKATKQLLKLHQTLQATIHNEVENKLSIFPLCQGVKKLTNHDYSYRLRIGNYRVFFEFDGIVKIVSIE